MEGDVYIFEIPIYRCTEDKYCSEMDAERSKQINKVALNFEESRKAVSDYFDKTMWYPWKYNEIIGLISIFHNEAEVRGDLWFVENRISRRLKRKRFFYRGNFFQYSPLFSEVHSITSEKIFRELRDTIQSFIDDSRISKYYFDFELFDNIGPFIDWKQLLYSEYFKR